MFNVIGISAFFHDSACCLLQDGRLTAAAQEERFSRRKHDPSLPVRAFRWCLDQADLTVADVHCVAYYERPFKKLERQLSQMQETLTAERCLRLWRRARRPVRAIRDILGFEGEVALCDHHESHAASAFMFSGFPEAAIFTVDSVGEWATTTYGAGTGERIEIFEEVPFPNSLGLLYSTITGYLGFAVNDGEYKVMGLAPYGEPRYVDQFWTLIHDEAGGQFRLDPAYFDFTRTDRMHSAAMPELFGVAPRRRGDPILQAHEDIARSLQVVLEAMLLRKLRYLHDRVPVDALCMAGGVALNCVANGRILREGPFKRLFVQPAAGDAGGSVGAAALAYARRRGSATPGRALDHVYLGPGYTNEAVEPVVRRVTTGGENYRGREPELFEATVDLLEAGQVVAWFQDRMEFGPRALGARSILADPRDPTMRDRINSLIKERESFRPFAPAVSCELTSSHFDLDHPSPFMLETCRVVSPLSLPAVTHVDGTARVQTVDRDTHPRFATLLERFHRRTGCPVLLNTSFNLRDEPIVATPADALLSFARSRLDALVIQDFLITRAQLNPTFVANCLRVAADTGFTDARAYTF